MERLGSVLAKNQGQGPSKGLLEGFGRGVVVPEPDASDEFVKRLEAHYRALPPAKISPGLAKLLGLEGGDPTMGAPYHRVIPR